MNDQVTTILKTIMMESLLLKDVKELENPKNIRVMLSELKGKNILATKIKPGKQSK